MTCDPVKVIRRTNTFASINFWMKHGNKYPHTKFRASTPMCKFWPQISSLLPHYLSVQPLKYHSASLDRLVGLVVRRLPGEQKVPSSNPACGGIFSGSSHTSDLNIGTPVATLPGAWRYRVSAGTGRPGVSILWLGEMESWFCSFYLSVAARTIVWADPSLRYTRMLLGR